MRKTKHKFIEQVAAIARCPFADLKKSYASFGFNCEGASAVTLCDDEGRLIAVYGSDYSEYETRSNPDIDMEWRLVDHVCKTVEGLKISRLYGEVSDKPFEFPAGCAPVDVPTDFPRVPANQKYDPRKNAPVAQHLLCMAPPEGRA